MIISVASMGSAVSPHFGHCANFNIFEVEDGKIVSQKNLPSPGHGHAILPDFLAELGTNLVIAGGMGAGAVEAFAKHNIETLRGATGEAVDAVLAYLKGELVSTNAVCSNHEHAHECGGHDGENNDHGCGGH